jgi:cobalt-zinc-cadmium efflux system membrane fusion protein
MLTAFIRETDAANVGVGQDIAFRVMAAPGRTFRGRLNYVAAAFDPTSRRLPVRATIDNADGVLKPEMFANVTLFSNDNSPNRPTAAVPKSAVIYEGDAARLWVAHDDRSIELRKIRIGLSDGNLIQVLSGVRTGEKVVTRGALFIDRTATDS